MGPSYAVKMSPPSDTASLSGLTYEGEQSADCYYEMYNSGPSTVWIGDETLDGGNANANMSFALVPGATSPKFYVTGTDNSGPGGVYWVGGPATCYCIVTLVD